MIRIPLLNSHGIKLERLYKKKYYNFTFSFSGAPDTHKMMEGGENIDKILMNVWQWVGDYKNSNHPVFHDGENSQTQKIIQNMFCNNQGGLTPKLIEVNSEVNVWTEVNYEVNFRTEVNYTSRTTSIQKWELR